jgi:putative membrane protein
MRLSMWIVGAALVSSAAAAEPARLSEIDLQVLAHVHHSDVTEVKAGKLAMDRAADKRVQAFGKMLVEEHGADARMIVSMVGKRGQVVPEMRPFDEAEKADLQLEQQSMAKLDELHSTQFDREFLRGQIAMHDKTLAKLDLEIAQIKDNPELVDMLRNERPVIVKHEQHAQQLLGLVGGNDRQRR